MPERKQYVSPESASVDCQQCHGQRRLHPGVSTALSEYVSWGYYDQGQNDYLNGYQSPPVNWSINTDRKRQFFELLRDVTGS